MNQALLPQIETILPRLDSALLDIQLLINYPVWQKSLYSIKKNDCLFATISEKISLLDGRGYSLANSHLNQIASDFSSFGENLKQTKLKSLLSTTEKTLQNINCLIQQLNNPNTSFRLFVNDRLYITRPDSTLLNASNLLIDIKDKPKKYIHFSAF